MINDNKKKKKKFLITMIIIMVCATMVNYGLYNILDIYFVKPSETYDGVQMNIITMIIIIGVITVIMLVLIPKENINEVLMSMENGGNNHQSNRSPDQQLQDMIDEELEKEGKK